MRILAVLFLFMPSLVFAEVSGPTVVTQWDIPSTLTDVSGYHIYCATVRGGPYTRVGEVQGATTKTATVTNCKPLVTTGSAYFVSMSFSVDGRESVYSNEAVRSTRSDPSRQDKRQKLPEPNPAVVEGSTRRDADAKLCQSPRF